MDQINGKLEAVIARLQRLTPTPSEPPSSESGTVLPFGPRTRLEVPEVAQGRGWTNEQEQLYANAARNLAGLQKAAGVPSRYQRYTWDTWEGPRRPDLLAWPAGPDGSTPWAVVAYGPPGRGKTHAATAVFHDMLCRGWKGRFFEVADAIEEIKAEFDDDVREGRTMKALLKTPLVFLDDMGAERATDFAADRISHVLRYRYSRELLTIVTTNHSSLTELDAIDPRLSSRLGGREALQLNFSERKDWRL